MIISKEERAALRVECKKYSNTPCSTDYKIMRLIIRLLDALEAAELKHTMPCPHCDFSSGQRGGARCSRCDGTGRVSVVDMLKQDRDYWKECAEAAERERGGENA